MASLAGLKSSALSLATNLRGWKSRRKLLIIESDDWGAIRMPSRQAWERLLAAGIRVDQSRYDSLDCLESRDDFQALMTVIDAHRDANGRPAVFTFNTVMGNPDFEAIEHDGFECFYHQHLFDSYRDYHGENLEPDWRKAMDQGLIHPQFHAREHVNVPLWMRDLKSDHSEAREAFTERFYGLTTKTSSQRQVNYLAAFWPESQPELASALRRLRSGLRMFQETFGYRSKTFIACNYILPDQAEPLLKHEGIRLLQGQRGQFVPSGQESSGRTRRNFTGQRTADGLLRSVRNVMFEPFKSDSNDWVDSALAQISQSFALRRPAIVSSHRVNYTGGLSRSHRDRSLEMLDRLLSTVRRRWPQVEFMSSDQLLKEMQAV